MGVVYTTVASREEASQIIDLQAKNLASVLSPAVARAQGFLTVRHDLEILWRMNQSEPSVIAKDGESVVGYALIMPKSFAQEVPILEPFFNLLETHNWDGRNFSKSDRWFVMGQVCVAEAYRGKKVFDGMYAKMREICRDRFDFTVTEVAERNTRSLRAHERVGFKTVHRYGESLTGENWRVIVLDF